MAQQTVGVLVIFRHGDRTSFYQSPTSYTPSNTAITPLGEQQEYQLGSLLRSRYFAQNSPYAIQGFNETVLNANQVYLSADAGGEGGVIYDSAVALSQGAFPATTANNITLANGTSILSPLGGYQYVPIESVEIQDDYTLESWTECPAYTVDNSAWYNSSVFAQKAQQSSASLQAIASVVGSRTVSLANMWNIFDYINVNYLIIHAEHVRQHSAAGERFSKLAPFIGVFNLTGVAQTYPEVAGIVDYAAALAFEIRYVQLTNSYTVTMQFKNGTYDSDFRTLNMFGSSDAAYPLAQFISKLQVCKKADPSMIAGVD
ncbi:hypothetical protein EMMF5_006001 [Cystobasidiomycetes sp. EMM_F5]